MDDKLPRILLTPRETQILGGILTDGSIGTKMKLVRVTNLIEHIKGEAAQDAEARIRDEEN